MAKGSSLSRRTTARSLASGVKMHSGLREAGESGVRVLGLFGVWGVGFRV